MMTLNLAGDLERGLAVVVLGFCCLKNSMSIGWGIHDHSVSLRVKRGMVHVRLVQKQQGTGRVAPLFGGIPSG